MKGAAEGCLPWHNEDMGSELIRRNRTASWKLQGGSLNPQSAASQREPPHPGAGLRKTQCTPSLQGSTQQLARTWEGVGRGGGGPWGP